MCLCAWIITFYHRLFLLRDANPSTPTQLAWTLAPLLFHFACIQFPLYRTVRSTFCQQLHCEHSNLHLTMNTIHSTSAAQRWRCPLVGFPHFYPRISILDESNRWIWNPAYLHGMPIPADDVKLVRIQFESHHFDIRTFRPTTDWTVSPNVPNSMPMPRQRNLFCRCLFWLDGGKEQCKYLAL